MYTSSPPIHRTSRIFHYLHRSKTRPFEKIFTPPNIAMASTFRMSTQKPIPTRFLNPSTGERGSFFPNFGCCKEMECADCQAHFRFESEQQTLGYARYTNGLSISDVSKIFLIPGLALPKRVQLLLSTTFVHWSLTLSRQTESQLPLPHPYNPTWSICAKR